MPSIIFAAEGLGLDFWLVVFVHGTLEITAIILASAAGLILGKAFCFPVPSGESMPLKQALKMG